MVNAEAQIAVIEFEHRERLILEQMSEDNGGAGGKQNYYENVLELNFVVSLLRTNMK